MTTPVLQSQITRFFSVESTDPLIVEQSRKHQQRKERAARLLQFDQIPGLERAELMDFFQDTDSWYGLRWNKEQYWRELFGEDDAGLPALQAALADLVRRGETGIAAEDFNALLKVFPKGIGPSFLSEMLALRFPDRYWLLNRQVRRFFESQEIDIGAELPRRKKSDVGEQYLVAGRHLLELRRALAAAAGRPVDMLLTDLFIYWSNKQARPEPLGEQITRWLSEFMPPQRTEARRAGEARARVLLEQNLGHFDEQILREFMSDLSADWVRGSTAPRRFLPALFGPQINLMARDLTAFNEWSRKIWHAADAELDALLDAFWRELEVGGAGISLPTALLYLRDPRLYNVWIPKMSTGLAAAVDFEPGEFRTAEGYRRYNRALNEFRDRYGIAPEALDVVLWCIAGAAEETDEVVTPPGGTFPGFTPDTFAFLQDLAGHNTSEWMHQSNDANVKRYRAAVREPLRALLAAVAPAVAALDPALETEAKFGKVLATVKKRWPDEKGPYYPHLWGAFYRANRTRQTDAQLFVSVHPTQVNVGLCVAGAQGSDVLATFRRNLTQAPEVFLRLLGSAPQGVCVAVAAHHGDTEQTIVDLRTAGDLDPLHSADLINIERVYPADSPALQQPGFAGEVSGLFRALYPLFRFVTAEDPRILSTIAEGLDEEPDEVDLVERYSFEKLCAETYLDPDTLHDMEALLARKRQIVLYGPPGVGKTWVATKLAKYWTEQAQDPAAKPQVVQFHPSYAYEEFVEGIRPQSVKLADGRSEIAYPVQKGRFWTFCEEARGHPDRRYVLIIDEINRGELPRIFGELLYLLEYRKDPVPLLYSGELFSIPPNVYLIGTMNTSDRSIALVDHALRRRFSFIPLRPSPEILRAYFESVARPEMAWVADLLEQTNRQLEGHGIDWELHIGHSHFMHAKLDEALLQLIWQADVWPTLEEYFYRQPERLRDYKLAELKLVIGREP